MMGCPRKAMIRLLHRAAGSHKSDSPADGELWIDFYQLQTVIEKMVQAIEQFMEQKRRVDQSGGYGSA